MSDLHDELVEEVKLATETVNEVIERVNSLTETIEEFETDVDDALERGKEATNP